MLRPFSHCLARELFEDVGDYDGNGKRDELINAGWCDLFVVPTAGGDEVARLGAPEGVRFVRSLGDVEGDGHPVHLLLLETFEEDLCAGYLFVRHVHSS